MKRIIKFAMFYLIFGLLAGVFYREFTKLKNYRGKTQLSVVHTHILVIGMMFLLIVAILMHQFKLEEVKAFKYFFIFFNIGLPLTVIMMITRGTMQVLDVSINKGFNASLSGISGIGHTLLGLAFILFFVALMKKIKTT